MATMASAWTVTMATFVVLVARNTYGNVVITDPNSGSQTAVVGDTITFKCLDPDGSELEWVMDSPFGELIIEDNPPYIVTSSVDTDGYKLYFTIEGVTEEDSGVFTCRAKQENGDAKVVTLTVKTEALPAGWVPPKIERREGQETIEVEVGKELRLKCEGGAPESVLEFRHNGDVINQDTHNLVTKATDVAKNLATVILSRDPTAIDYSGTYSCHDVSVPDPSDSVQVDVLEHPSTRVEIIEPSGTQTKVMVGDTFSLKCQSSEQTTITWYHDEDELEDQVSGYMISVSEDSQMHTRTSLMTKEDAQFEDAGEYRCVNADSPQDDATIQVDVRAEGDEDGDGDDDDDGGFLGSLFGSASFSYSYLMTSFTLLVSLTVLYVIAV